MKKAGTQKARSKQSKAAAQSQPGMTFQSAARAVPQIAKSVCMGVQALREADRKRIHNTKLATGSIDLDEALRTAYPNDPRWDYGIGLPGDARKERVLWLEVHHAASGETERVLNKLAALKSWLAAQAPELQKLPRLFVWQLSNVESNPNDRRKRNQAAEKHGLVRMSGILDLARLR